MKTIVIIGFIFFAGYASAETTFRTDSFVRVIERQVGGDMHRPVVPGTTGPIPDCGDGIGCTIKYVGAKREGHVYWFGLQKLD